MTKETIADPVEPAELNAAWDKVMSSKQQCGHTWTYTGVNCEKAKGHDGLHSGRGGSWVTDAGTYPPSSKTEINRDKVLRGEVVKVTDDRLREMQEQARRMMGVGDTEYHWHWSAVINELIARRAVETSTSRKFCGDRGPFVCEGSPGHPGAHYALKGDDDGGYQWETASPEEPSQPQCAYIGAPQGAPDGCILSAGHSGPHKHAMKASEPIDLNLEPIGKCDKCGRKVWKADTIGKLDEMTQPDGSQCGGRFVAL